MGTSEKQKIKGTGVLWEDFAKGMGAGIIKIIGMRGEDSTPKEKR